MSKPSAWPTRTPRTSSASISDYVKAVLESIGATTDKEHDGELKLNPITRVELLDSKGPSGPKNKAKHTEMTINAGARRKCRVPYVFGQIEFDKSPG